MTPSSLDQVQKGLISFHLKKRPLDSLQLDKIFILSNWV